jgi:hypothetical protein
VESIAQSRTEPAIRVERGGDILAYREDPSFSVAQRSVAVILPDHVKARDAHVQPHRLEPYDQLKEQGDE